MGVRAPRHAPLSGKLEVDVAVIGGGITGLTGAYLAARSGKSVAVLERGTVAGGETGRTTGFLTEVLDARLVDLVAVHGTSAAKSAWESSRKGIDIVESIIREAGIECDFRRVDAVLYGPRVKDRELLRQEAACARSFGFRVDPIEPRELPFPCRAAFRVSQQARIHPKKYMIGLSQAIRNSGGQIYDHTATTGLRRARTGPRRRLIVTERPEAQVRADEVLLASNAPFSDRRAMYSRLRPCRSYAIAAPVPHGLIPDGLFWNTLDPYDYARLDGGPRTDELLLGGADHDVGQPGAPERAAAKVLAYWRTILGSDPIDPVSWSGEILNSEDGLPFIGANPGSPLREMIATGFGGNGLTFGTLAGWMFTERLAGRPTPWDKIYDPDRATRSTTGTGLAARPRPRTGASTRIVDSLDRIGVGEGAWYAVRGRRVGVYRAGKEDLRAVDSRCTHLG
jgi:glycine/D-amino acid oxidase-like deaminating enzyme